MKKPAQRSDRVRAWVYAVINPWAEALAFENQFLADGSVTYRWRRDNLEHLKPIRAHLAPNATLILHDLARYRPAVAKWELDHDRSLDELRFAASKAFVKLTSSEFTTAVARASESTPEEARKAEEHSGKRVSTMAERVINSIGEISPNYADAAFWATHRSAFMSFRSGEEFDTLDRIRGEVERKNEALSRRLGTLRDELVDDFDIPPAYVE